MKQRMRQIMALGLSAVMCFSITACGGGGEEVSQSSNEAGQTSVESR